MINLDIFKKHPKKWSGLATVLVILFIISKVDSVQSLVSALSPPNLPKLQVQDKYGEWVPQVWMDQNWGNQWDSPSADTKKYHHLSQGTRTLPLPYDWFLSLEQPASSLFTMPFGEKPVFVDNEYLLRFGFIRSEPDAENNPDGLPIGFAKTSSQNVNGFTTQTDTIGFTCAACHTSHFIYDDGKNGPREYIVEGGPATTDLGLLEESLTAAIGQLVLSAEFGIVGGRFDRFAKRLLGTQYNATTKVRLKSDLVSFAGAQLGSSDIIEVTEGFSRLDALNRIGNAVFSENIDRPQNKAPIDAPVNYPHIWTSPWFNWVQYDASVMGPLIRNVGEALGVKAFIDVKSSPEDHRFSSSVPINNMVWMEKFLSGEQPTKETGFSGLKAPIWPLTEVDSTLAQKGQEIYLQYCEGCHLPVINSERIWEPEYMAPIKWYQGDSQQQTENPVLQLKVIPLNQIGTDIKQAGVMVTRTMDTSGIDNGPFAEKTTGMLIDSVICARDFNQLARAALSWGDQTEKPKEYDEVPLIEQWITDGANVSFGYALAATVQKTIDAWFKVNGLSDPDLQKLFEEGRPNCIQAGFGYKARPLNGVWATAPFLHNGSVPTLKDLLCPTDGKRPDFVQLGNPVYDTVNMGILQPDGFQRIAKKRLKKFKNYDKQGYFILDTRVIGNHNTGHEFSDRYDLTKPYWQQEKGVIGPKLEPEACNAILEYLKTI